MYIENMLFLLLACYLFSLCLNIDLPAGLPAWSLAPTFPRIPLLCLFAAQLSSPWAPAGCTACFLVYNAALLRFIILPQNEVCARLKKTGASAEVYGNMKWRSLGPDRRCTEKSVSSL